MRLLCRHAENLATQGGQTWLLGITNYTCCNDIARSRMMHTSYNRHCVDKITRGMYLVETVPWRLTNLELAT